ncbi:uncharacterized protein BP5553_02423 [Venustampulla echinocandica]|uniref:Tat pathway signal sequence n=1 Tax=Venustampulla echinocandica TaxID=2656787 RepID=A0A370U3U7_9HELO|nr:uncharacterized protein BP5553_02423 [Venustampulla echinocandica]RDL42444.1 hypothetical protein BP5553_02423 [Venustampulla echinocandica]
MGKTDKHRRASSVSSSLPPISQDGSFHGAPPVPERSTYRLSNGRAMGLPGFEFENHNPPQYGTYSEAYSSVTEKHSERSVASANGSNSTSASKKYGWRKLVLYGVIIALVILGIGLGVGLGLGNRHKSSSTSQNESIGSASSSSSSPPSSESGSAQDAPPANLASTTTFPAGSYTFNTYLSPPVTDCTSNPSTWLCYPYSTYGESASSSSAAFDWVISKVPNTPNNYSISSTKNPIDLTFTNLPLTLKSAGTAEEHYFLQTPMEKTTKPTTQLGSDSVAATCHFTDTTFQAYLYTKKPKTYPKSDENGAYTAWPHAVKVEQVSGGGAGTPSCIGPSGSSLGDFSVEDNGLLCDCLYLNTGT